MWASDQASARGTELLQRYVSLSQGYRWGYPVYPRRYGRSTATPEIPLWLEVGSSREGHLDGFPRNLRSVPGRLGLDGRLRGKGRPSKGITSPVCASRWRHHGR